MTALVTLDRKTGEPMLDSRVAARELGLEHESVLRLFSERPELGIEYSDLKSEKSGKRGQPAKFALLTERQALLLITMVRNTDEAIIKKFQLVDAFLDMRNAVNERRIEKAVHRELTDAVQASPVNDAMHGWAFKTLTDLIYKATIGMDAKHYREANGLDEKANVREHLTAIQNKSVASLEKMVGSMLDMGMDYYRIKEIVFSMSQKRVSE